MEFDPSPGLKEGFHFLQKRWELGLEDIPDASMVNFGIAMDRDVAERDDPLMLLGLCGRPLILPGESTKGFTDNLELPCRG